MSFHEWIELESDPGLFTLLMYDFGVKGVEVEEVYDLTKPIDKNVYGFIFLFKWTEERKSRRKAGSFTEESSAYDEHVEKELFFAEQIIPNSCASHALLSVLLNVKDLNVGYTLKQLRDSCVGFDAETKGHAIGNFWNIAIAHNNHGRAELRWQQDRSKNITGSTRSMEAFHYVSYIPYNGALFELDGLKPHPINHGPWYAEESWTDKARKVIQDRIRLATGGELSHDIRYNLMAIVPEQRISYQKKMDILIHNKKVLIELFKNLAHKESFVSDIKSMASFKEYQLTQHVFKKPIYSGPNSPVSSNSSTITGHESPTHPFSDSEDSTVESYRVKSIMRGQMKGPVFVYGDVNSKHISDENKRQTIENGSELDKEMKQANLNNGISDNVESTNNSQNSQGETSQEIDKSETKMEFDSNCEKETELKDSCGVGVEIIADDIDISFSLDPTRLVKLNYDHLIKYEDKIKLEDLQKCMQGLDEMYKSCQVSYKEELEKIERFKIDDSRRRHNYDPFISTFLTMLAEQGHIANLLEQQNTIIKRVSTAYVKTNNNTVKKENKTIKKAKGKKIIKKKKKKV